MMSSRSRPRLRLDESHIFVRTMPNASIPRGRASGVIEAPPRLAAGPVAQWLEPAAHNRLVAGSSPAGPTSAATRAPPRRSRGVLRSCALAHPPPQRSPAVGRQARPLPPGRRSDRRTCRLGPVNTTRLEVRRRFIVPTRTLLQLVNAGASSAQILQSAMACMRAAGACRYRGVGRRRDAGCQRRGGKTLGAPNIFCGRLRRLGVGAHQRWCWSPSRAWPSMPNHLVCLPPSPVDIASASSTERGAQRFGRANPPARVGVLIGGNSGAFRYREKDWLHLIGFLRDAHRSHGIRWLATTSRRSGPFIADALAAMAAEPDSGLETFIDFRTAGPGTLARISPTPMPSCAPTTPPACSRRPSGPACPSWRSPPRLAPWRRARPNIASCSRNVAGIDRSPWRSSRRTRFSPPLKRSPHAQIALATSLPPPSAGACLGCSQLKATRRRKIRCC